MMGRKICSEGSFMFLTLFFCASILGRSNAADPTDIEAWRWSKSLDSNLTLATTVDTKSKELSFYLKLNVTNSNASSVHGVRVGISPEAKITNDGTHFIMAFWQTENSTTEDWNEYFTVNGTNVKKDAEKQDFKKFSFQSGYRNDSDKTWYEVNVSIDRGFGVNDTALGREIKNETTYLIWGYGLGNKSETGYTLVNVIEGSMPINLLKQPVFSGSVSLSQPITSILFTAIFSVLLSFNFGN